MTPRSRSTTTRAKASAKKRPLPKKKTTAKKAAGATDVMAAYMNQRDAGALLDPVKVDKAIQKRDRQKRSNH